MTAAKPTGLAQGESAQGSELDDVGQGERSRERDADADAPPLIDEPGDLLIPHAVPQRAPGLVVGVHEDELDPEVGSPAEDLEGGWRPRLPVVGIGHRDERRGSGSVTKARGPALEPRSPVEVPASG